MHVIFLAKSILQAKTGLRAVTSVTGKKEIFIPSWHHVIIIMQAVLLFS